MERRGYNKILGEFMQYPDRIETLSKRIKILQNSINFCKHCGGSSQAAFEAELRLRKSELKKRMQQHLKTEQGGKI